MGEVFAAKRVDGDFSGPVEVAIKVVSRSVVDDTLMARLEREAIAARRIRSLYVPEVYEVDRTESGELYLVMRRLHGESLQTRLKEKRALHFPEVERIVDDVLSALIDAHAAGVVHRDLKPGNIFLEQVDEPTIPSHTPPIAWKPGTDPYALYTVERAMILDFGVCKMDTSDGPKLTVTGESVGTISYMAPEQIRGASDVDARADLYSLAMVVFEAVSGRIAFDQAGQMAILAAKLEGRAKRLRDHAVVAVPPGLDALVAKALSRRAEDRFASAREMQQAWRALGPATESPRALLDAPNSEPHPTQNALTAGTHTRMGTFVPRAGLLVALAGVLASIAALAIAFHKPKHVPPVAADFVDDNALVAPAPTHGVAETSSATLAASVQTTQTIEISDAPIGVDAGAHPHPHFHRHGAPHDTGPHITTEPRY
jgi:serine/threonine-protein kinase